MNFRLYPILIDLIISQIYDCNFIGDPTPAPTCPRGFSGAFVHHPHTSYVWLKISTVSESTLVTNTNVIPPKSREMDFFSKDGFLIFPSKSETNNDLITQDEKVLMSCPFQSMVILM